MKRSLINAAIQRMEKLANDNRFSRPPGRFPQTEGDRSPCRPLCNGYPPAPGGAG